VGRFRDIVGGQVNRIKFRATNQDHSKTLRDENKLEETLLKTKKKRKVAAATHIRERKSCYRMEMLIVVLHLLAPKARL
jgi:hypothetical protein